MHPFTVIDPLAYVRNHPTMFFADAAPNPVDCIQYLVTEVLSLGGRDLSVKAVGPWWVCGSTFDWFGAHDPATMFSRIVPLPAYRDNACGVEILLAAFAESVATYGASTGELIVSGDAPPEDVRAEMRTAGRALAFRFPPAALTELERATLALLSQVDGAMERAQLALRLSNMSSEYEHLPTVLARLRNRGLVEERRTDDGSELRYAVTSAGRTAVE